MQTDFNIGQMQSLPVDHHQLASPVSDFHSLVLGVSGKTFAIKHTFWAIIEKFTR